MGSYYTRLKASLDVELTNHDNVLPYNAAELLPCVLIINGNHCYNCASSINFKATLNYIIFQSHYISYKN